MKKIKRKAVENPHRSNHQATRSLPPDEEKKALQSIPRDTRTLQQRLFGDPLVGRSALDRRGS